MSYSCSECGYESPRWLGFCPQCRHPGPLAETPSASRRSGPRPMPRPLGQAPDLSIARSTIGIGELDRVLGGGIVAGSVVLVGGEPGIGKSTLLLQAAASLAGSGGPVLVATAEESADQVALRAQRLGIASDAVLVLADDDAEGIVEVASRFRPRAVVVDSIQTVGVNGLSGSPGSPAQVRESANRLIRFAKETGTAVVLVGHVTKDGSLAGPKLLEHMVDVVLSLEGDADRGFRALRCSKNRFGPTDVVALFDMRTEGMVEVEDPSAAFLAEWHAEVPGTIVYPAVEGSRAVLVEVQALVSPTSLSQPRRSVRGVDAARVHQILAVLERHCGIVFSAREVYVNVVGGWRIDEPAADLAVALAVAGSALDLPLGTTAAWGEVGLAGEVRPVPFDRRRREEAVRMGVERLVRPDPGARLVEILADRGLSAPAPT